MAVPSKAQQIQRVEDWLASEDNDEKTVGELAKILVDGMYDMWGKEMTDPPLRPHVGMAFKMPFMSTVQFVGWMGEEFGKEVVWIVNATTDFGWLLEPESRLWSLASPSTAKAGAPGTNADGWMVGDSLSLSQRRLSLTTLAVGTKTILMRSSTDLSLWAESNANLKKYYKKEKNK